MAKETAGSALARFLTRRGEGASPEELAQLGDEIRERTSSQLGGAAVVVTVTGPLVTDRGNVYERIASGVECRRRDLETGGDVDI